MSFASRCECVVHADVKLLGSDAKPNAATSAQLLGLFDLRQAQQSSEEAPSVCLAPHRGSDLHMIKPEHAHIHNLSRVSLSLHGDEPLELVERVVQPSQ